jgi:hypothetical protein
MQWDLAYYVGLILKDTRRMLPVYAIGVVFVIAIFVTRWITKKITDKQWRSDERRLHELARDKIRYRDLIIDHLKKRVTDLETSNGILRANIKGALSMVNIGMDQVHRGSLELISAGFTKINQGLAILGGVEPVGTREESGFTREGKEAQQDNGRSKTKANSSAIKTRKAATA